MVAMFGPLGPMEIGIIAAIALLIFGPKQIPKMGRAIGETLREFRGIGQELTGAKDAAEQVGRTVEREVRAVTAPLRDTAMPYNQPHGDSDTDPRSTATGRSGARHTHPR